MKKAAYYRYKSFLRKSQAVCDRERNNKLRDDLVNKDTIGVGNFYTVRVVMTRLELTVIEKTQTQQIVLQNHFKLFIDQMIMHLFLHSNPNSRYHDEHLNDDISNYYLSPTDVLDIVEKMQPGKATARFVKHEHILNGSPKLLIFFSTALFNTEPMYHLIFFQE